MLLPDPVPYRRKRRRRSCWAWCVPSVCIALCCTTAVMLVVAGTLLYFFIPRVPQVRLDDSGPVVANAALSASRTGLRAFTFNVRCAHAGVARPAPPPASALTKCLGLAQFALLIDSPNYVSVGTRPRCALLLLLLRVGAHACVLTLRSVRQAWRIWTLRCTTCAPVCWLAA